MLSKQTTSKPSAAFQNALQECISGYYIDRGYISERWTTGGLTGGNCWGNNADVPVSASPEPEFHDLDSILEHLCPGISFMQYKKLIQEVVVTREGTETEYYGNYYHYAEKCVYLASLESYLIQKGLWTPPNTQS